ncbi:MAG TPA: hypothetical protein VF933_14580 [Streptosporangiaceae bacterium]
MLAATVGDGAGALDTAAEALADDAGPLGFVLALRAAGIVGTGA